MGQRILIDLRKYGIAAAAVLLLYFLMHAVFNAFCPLVVLTGFPCPGCGLTRSVLFFVTGQWNRSFSVHPLGGAVVVFVLYCAWFRYVRGKKVPGFAGILAVLTAAAVVLYAVRMHLYFPVRPPYTYNHGNLLEKLVPRYIGLKFF